MNDDRGVALMVENAFAAVILSDKLEESGDIYWGKNWEIFIGAPVQCW